MDTYVVTGLDKDGDERVIRVDAESRKAAALTATKGVKPFRVFGSFKETIPARCHTCAFPKPSFP